MSDLVAPFQNLNLHSRDPPHMEDQTIVAQFRRTIEDARAAHQQHPRSVQLVCCDITGINRLQFVGILDTIRSSQLSGNPLILDHEHIEYDSAIQTLTVHFRPLITGSSYPNHDAHLTETTQNGIRMFSNVQLQTREVVAYILDTMYNRTETSCAFVLNWHDLSPGRVPAYWVDLFSALNTVNDIEYTLEHVEEADCATVFVRCN